jgi:hypothetical protein
VRTSPASGETPSSFNFVVCSAASPPPYIPDVVPEPNFIEPSSAFSSFHESMAPSAYQAGRPEDDMFFEGYKTTQSSQPFEEQTKQIINGRVYTRMGESNGMKPAEYVTFYVKLASLGILGLIYLC